MAAVTDPVAAAPATGPCPRSELTVDNDANARLGRELPIRLRCVAAPSRCRGGLRLEMTERGTRLNRPRRYSIPAGRSRTLHVRLTERGYRALQQLAERQGWEHEPFPPAPGFPAERGAINVSRLAKMTEPLVLVSGIDRWARSTWVAYAAMQPAARDWIQQALLLIPDRKF